MLQQRLDPVAISDTCTMNFRPQYQALRIHQKVTLSALDLLATVVAAFFATHISSFDRLAVDYACAGLRIAPETNPQTFAHHLVHPLPGSIQTPSSEVMKDRFPGREVVGQESL